MGRESGCYTDDNHICRDYKSVVKTGSADDEAGKVSYNVIINPAAKDLDPNKDVIELVDTMTLNANWNTLNDAAMLEVESLALYYYDPSKDYGLGERVFQMSCISFGLTMTNRL